MKGTSVTVNSLQQVYANTVNMNKFKATIRKVLKKPLGIAFRFTPQVRRAIKNGLTVFVFHEVTDQPSRFAEEHSLAVSKKMFHHQVSWIQSKFSIIHPAEVLNGTPLPEHSAIISFDDGFFSTFENGLAILEKLGVPSIVFLNMQAILEHKPILSAIACYLNRYVPEFSDFMKSKGISSPFYLTLSPTTLQAFEEHCGPVDSDAVLYYQGRFADLNTVKAWDNKNTVVFGNHLYDHWNAAALSIEELTEQYQKNEIALKQLNNSVNLFSFTNGHPGTCFSERDVNILHQLNVRKVFSAVGGVNRDVNSFLFGRIIVGDRDKDEYHLWFRIGQAVLNDLLLNRIRGTNNI
jgi:peptidoglycan/xylan/chitin deacetylase (PgdA/CDA1 family)